MDKNDVFIEDKIDRRTNDEIREEFEFDEGLSYYKREIISNHEYS